MKNFVKINRREVAAYHEAGHAVMHMLFGDEIISISVEDNGSGLVHCPVPYPTSYLSPFVGCFKKMEPAHVAIIINNFRRKLKRYAMINIAGYYSEYKFLKKRMPYNLTFSNNDQNDFSKIRNEILEANNVFGKPVFWEFDLYIWDKETRKVINRQIVWETIQDIANALLESKGGKIFPDIFGPIFLKRLTPYLERKYHTIKF